MAQNNNTTVSQSRSKYGQGIQAMKLVVNELFDLRDGVDDPALERAIALTISMYIDHKARAVGVDLSVGPDAIGVSMAESR